MEGLLAPLRGVEAVVCLEVALTPPPLSIGVAPTNLLAFRQQAPPASHVGNRHNDETREHALAHPDRQHGLRRDDWSSARWAPATPAPPSPASPRTDHQTIQHPAITHTVHHDVIQHRVVHDAITHIVQHPAITHVVTAPAITHVQHHDAIQHTLTVPAVTHTEHVDAVTHIERHAAVTHTERVPAETHVVHHAAVTARRARRGCHAHRAPRRRARWPGPVVELVAEQLAGSAGLHAGLPGRLAWHVARAHRGRWPAAGHVRHLPDRWRQLAVLPPRDGTPGMAAYDETVTDHVAYDKTVTDKAGTTRLWSTSRLTTRPSPTTRCTSSVVTDQRSVRQDGRGPCGLREGHH